MSMHQIDIFFNDRRWILNFPTFGAYLFLFQQVQQP